MTILKAVQRLSWRFAENKSFLPNDNDVDALNEIIKFVNNANKEAVAHNQGFAKLYTMFYWQMVDKYKTSIFDPIPQKEVNRLLDMPLSYFFRKFTKNLIESDRYEILSSAIEDRGDALTQTDEQKKATVEKLAEILKDPQEVDKLIGYEWSEEEVGDNLMAMISAAVNKYNFK